MDAKDLSVWGAGAGDFAFAQFYFAATASYTKNTY